MCSPVLPVPRATLQRLVFPTGESDPGADKTIGTMNDTLRRLFSAAPDLGFGLVYLVTWISPVTFGEGMIGYLMLTMVLEFIVMHSAAFMGQVMISDAPRRGKTMSIVGLGLFYSLFVIGFALSFGRWWPLWALWTLTLNRLTGVMFGTAPSDEEKLAIQAAWAASAMLYLVWGGLTTMLPVPRVGITIPVVQRAALPGSGLWIDEPQRVIAFGAAYFLSQAAYELTEPRWRAVLAKGLPARTDATL